MSISTGHQARAHVLDVEANWAPTKSGGGFEALFRFYETWKLGDIEEVK